MPQPGLWGCPEPSARSSSDLATYRYRSPPPWGARGSTHPEAPWVPLPYLGPSSSTRTAKTRGWETQTNQEKPVLLTPGGSCPVALPPFEPSSLLACGASESPPPRRRTCFDLLRVGTTWCAEGEGTSGRPHPALTARTGQDCGLGAGHALGRHLLWNRESKPIFPDLPSAWPGQRTPPTG